MPKFKVYVDQETCIGCGACVVVCPENFVMETDKAKAVNENISEDKLSCNRDAKESCPVDAIKIEEAEEIKKDVKG